VASFLELNRPLGLNLNLRLVHLLCAWVSPQPPPNSKIWPLVDPASMEGWLGAQLQAQGRMLAEHTRLLTEAAEAVATVRQELRGLTDVQRSQAEQLSVLTTLVHASTTQVPTPVPASPQSGLAVAAAPAPSASPDREPHLATPAPYDGTFTLCWEFLMQCEYAFELQPSMYSTAAAPIAYMANLTTGRACRWVMVGREGAAAYTHAYRAFVVEFKTVFDHDVHGQDAAAALSVLQQGSSSVADYATEFRILVARCAWNESAFQRGLGKAMKDALSGRESPITLDQLISQSINLDERTRERERERAHLLQVPGRLTLPGPVWPIPSQSPPDPRTPPVRSPCN